MGVHVYGTSQWDSRDRKSMKVGSSLPTVHCGRSPRTQGQNVAQGFHEHLPIEPQQETVCSFDHVLRDSGQRTLALLSPLAGGPLSSAGVCEAAVTQDRDQRAQTLTSALVLGPMMTRADPLP